MNPRFAVAVSLASLALACSAPDEPLHHKTTRGASSAAAPIPVAARTPLLPTYPCSRCHADRAPAADPQAASGTDGRRAPDPRERRLTEFHTQKLLSHGDSKGWCYRCHTKDDIDKLHEPDGTLVSFDEAYELCGACHGDKLRDWKKGIHGLTTGMWNGPKLRRSCTFCHDPHNPKFPAMTPERPPARPRTAAHEDRHEGH